MRMDILRNDFESRMVLTADNWGGGGSRGVFFSVELQILGD
eukprot:COSAG02_NODE_666_length_18722_cov_237.372765_2_plen_41_part_00